MLPDAQIKHAVLQELAWDTRVKETEVGVEVDRGVVTLTGTVDSYAKKLAAQEAAHHVVGVLDVVNNLHVHAFGQGTGSDTELAHRVRQTLEWDVLVPDHQITSTVEDGWVTLAGQVEVWNQREEAERAIRFLAGVRGVTNLITVTPQQITPYEVRRTLQAALERRAVREAARIQVAVTGGTVTLSGRVQSWFEKRAILGAIRHAPGVEAVDDHLRIEPVR
jgi:osmotically-inducible protein OsmY